MKLQRYRIDEDGDLEKDDKWGRYCLDEDVEPLEAENAELHMECDRLTNLLQWEQNRRDHIGTHGDECWKWGPSHYECASREIEKRRVLLGIGITTNVPRFSGARPSGAPRNYWRVNERRRVRRTHENVGIRKRPA